MDWEHIAAIVATLFSATGLGLFGKLWLAYKRLQIKGAADAAALEEKIRREIKKEEAQTRREALDARRVELEAQQLRDREVDARQFNLMEEMNKRAREAEERNAALLTQMSAMQVQQATMAADLQKARSEYAELQNKYAEIERRLDQERTDSARRIEHLQKELDAALAKVAELKAHVKVLESQSGIIPADYGQ